MNVIIFFVIAIHNNQSTFSTVLEANPGEANTAGEDTDSTLPTSPAKRPRLDPEPGTSGTKRGGDQSTQPDAKRKLTSSQEGGTIPKASTSGTTNQATSIIGGHNPNAPSTAEEQPAQIDLPEGNAPNTRGTVQGEAGSRKQQKARGRVFGLIEVGKMYRPNNKVHHTLILCYNTQESADQFCDLLEMTWSNIPTRVFKHHFTVEQEWFIVCFTYSFNCKWTTLFKKFGKFLTDAVYISDKQIFDDLQSPEAKTKIINVIQLCLTAEIATIDIDERMDIERKFITNNAASTYESPTKKARWSD